MEQHLEVVLSSSIKRKKPWPRFCWLGKEKESVFLLDDKRISEINMVSGRTRKKIPKIQPLLNSVVAMTSSCNGMWLCGLLVSGELFLWNRDKDLLKSAAAVPEVFHMISAFQGTSTRLSLQVSSDGMRVLVVAITGQVFLWECFDMRDLTGLRGGTVKGRWAHICPLEDNILPSLQDKDACQHTIFVKTEVTGDACLSAFVFTSGMKLIITCLKIQWEEGHVRMGSEGYSIQWATKTYDMSRLTPSCQPVKSRGALVSAFSPDGRLLAVVLNQRQPKATQVLFVSTQNFVSISSGLGGCGSTRKEIPSKYLRSYWVGSVCWSPDSLFLACVLKRGSLLMVSRLGGLLTLTSSGCSVDFGPAHFLPFHPLVTYRPPLSAEKGEESLSSSSLSVRDVFRQRYSVTWHPRLLYLIVSDGYMATVMRVLGQPSPALMLKALLKDMTQDLEKASRILENSQVHVRAWLDSVSGLNLGSSLEGFMPKTTGSVLSAAKEGSTLPLFLQDQSTLSGTKELLEKVQAFFEDGSDDDGAPAGSHVEDGGRLEFASMFDTLHALDTETDTGLVTSPMHKKKMKTQVLRGELEKIQSKLLAVWAFGMSLGNTVENKSLLLKHTLCCVVRFAALLHLSPSSVVHTRKKSTSLPTCLLDLLRALLSFLPWDGIYSDGPRSLGLVVDLTKKLISLLLTPKPESHQSGQCQFSSRSLSAVLLILRQVSDSLDHAYGLQQGFIWSSVEKGSQPPQLWPSDVHHVPLLQDEKEEKSSFAQEMRPFPQQPSSRLLSVWQWVYRVTQQYIEELKSFQGCDGLEEEQHQLTVIMSQIQAALQSAGAKLEEGPALLSHPGEYLYLCGSYAESVSSWWSQICERNSKSCDRSVFRETKLCLALLYTLLSQYRLREAQEFGDHMARLILHRAGHLKNIMAADSLSCPWLSVDLHSEAACAVVQTLGRFMASYFTNQPLYICPPHHVAFVPPLHVPHGPSTGRLVPLCQEEVSRTVRQEQLSEVWTVEYAQDLLLLGSLLPETVWLAYRLGDWKAAVSLSLAYTSYCTDQLNLSLLRRRELHLPRALEPQSIFQVELERLLCSRSDSQECSDKDDASFTEPLEGEDWDMLQVSIQEILKASVMAGVNVLSSPLFSLLDRAKALCLSLPILVPIGLYLPSPPLYCPQPSPNTQDQTGHFAEVASRHKVSGVLQRLLLLLRSALCCHPAAQWYISHLRRCKHILHKIKKKYSYPSVAEEAVFPEGLMKFVTRAGVFRWGPNKDLDPDTIQIITCFRELCALCWMLHVRDQLSIACRKYQAARQRGRDGEISDGPDVTSACVKALCWARRFLPFSCFLNTEEKLQDILLSLMSELPPLLLVADTLVQAFPEEEESVRVALREKYNSLLQRLRHCSVLDGEKEEENALMMIVIQEKRRQRRKHLARLQRHLAPPELRLWEKEEEEEDRGSQHGMAVLRQLSLGTSLSSSTLTDCGIPPVHSEGDTTDNTSDAVSPETHSRARSKKSKQVRENEKRTTVKHESATQDETHPGIKENEQPSPPTVGTWEFEQEDEEYLNFLELFLSYVLEKGSVNEGEPPLLKHFSSQLRERELHSLTFDVLTTVHRRQRDTHHLIRKPMVCDPPVFRAGCCYNPVKEDVTPDLRTSHAWTEELASRASFSASSLPEQDTGKQNGLFARRQQSSLSLSQRRKGGLFGPDTSPIQRAVPTEPLSKSFIFGSPTSLVAAAELQQDLDPKVEAQFPGLRRLLEWMVRWADKRVLVTHHGKWKKESGGGVGERAGEGVMIRVKASAPAILTSLSLLQSRLATLLGVDGYSAHIDIRERQWTVTPVLQPEVDRESSVDTGYPGSANTPIAGLDDNMQQAESSVSSPTDEPEELTFLTTPLLNDQDQLTLDAGQRQSSSQQLCLHDLDVTTEKEVVDKSSASEGLEVSTSASNVNLSGNICMHETSLKLADLDFSKDAEDVSSASSLNNCAKSLQDLPQPESQCPTAFQPGTEDFTQPSGSDEVHTPITQVDPPIVQPLNTTADPPTVQPLLSTAMDPPRFEPLPKSAGDPSAVQPQSSTGGTPHTESTAPNQILFTQTPPIRQRLGEDLFRLVQNINYMSLMEVLGASFSNLQLAQQSYTLAQSNVNFSHPSVSSSHPASFYPQPSTVPVQNNISSAHQRQACVPQSGSSNPVCISADQPAGHSSGNYSPTGCHHHRTSINLPSTANDAGVSHQEVQPLFVQAPESDFRENGRLIPPSQGLLATAEPSQCASVLNLSNAPPQRAPAAEVFGKLLKLPPSPSAQQTASDCPRVQDVNTTISGNQSKRAEEDKGNWYSVPKRQVSFSPLQDPAQRKTRTSERTREKEFELLPPALPAPVQGLRLLHFQPVPQSVVRFPRIPSPSSFRPPPVFAAPIREAPVIKLLHIDSETKMELPVVPASSQVTKLISMDELTRSATVKQGAEKDGRSPTLPTSISSKRQKRREEREHKPSKAEVTFRPNESIIPSPEPINESVNEKPASADEITPGQDAAIPLGSSDCLLTGQRLLDQAMATSAELHAFASTCKRPPEYHDAFTNTEPACPPPLVDKAVSVSAAVSRPMSQVSGNREEIPHRPEKKLERNGRQFISVLDLEDEALHQDFQLRLSPGAPDFPSVKPSSPADAQLHLPSVIRNAAPDPQPIITVPDDLLKLTTHADMLDESPSLSHMDRTRDAEGVSPEERIKDPQDSQMCGATKTQIVGPPGASSIPPTVWFSSHLSQMHAQLAALQNIADSLKDFSSSRMLVNTVETRTPPDVTPNVKTTSAVKKAVRLSVPQEAKAPRWDILTDLEVGENLTEVIRNKSRTPEKKPSPQYSTSSRGYSAGPSKLRASSSKETRNEMADTSGISSLWEEESLGHTGLSDTAELLDELVREGYLSPTDLDLNSSQTEQHSRLDPKRSGWMMLKHVRPDDERRQLRVWMRKKQRERMAVYQKHREKLREREHQPFSSSGTTKPNKNLATSQRMRVEKEKFMLLDQYSQRSREVCSFISSITSNPATGLSQAEGSSVPTTTRDSSVLPPSGCQRVSASDKRNVKAERAQTQLPPWTVEVPSGDYRKRLGLHRPVTSLPRDRLSQVTKRGMISHSTGQSKVHSASQSQELHCENQRKVGLSKTPARGTPAGRGILRDRTRVGGEDMNVWEFASEGNDLLGTEDSNRILAGLLDEEDIGDITGVLDMDWLDNLSETGSSCLSKIDWAAIERMTAEV